MAARPVSIEPVIWTTVSIGVAQYEQDEDVDRLLERADVAVYDAKRAGRNRVCVREAVIA